MVDGKVFAKDKSKAEKLDSGWAVLMVVLLEVESADESDNC